MQVVLLLLLASHDPEPCRNLELIGDWKKAARCWGEVADENRERRRSLAVEAHYRRGLCLLAIDRHHRAERSFRWVVEHAEDPTSFPAAHSAFLLLERRYREVLRGRGNRRMLIAAYERIADRGNEEVRRLALDRIATLLGRATREDRINRSER